MRLTKLIGLELSEEYEEWMDEISTFNLNTRYDNYKQDFYKICTSDYTSEWIKKIETLRLWLMKEL